MQKAELRTSTKQNCCKQTSVVCRCLLSAGMRLMWLQSRAVVLMGQAPELGFERDLCALSSIAELDEAWVRLYRALHEGK